MGVGLSTKGLNRDLGRMRRGFNRSFGEIQKAGRKMSTAISAPLIALGATASKVFVGFEHSMAKVRAVSGATGAEFTKLEQSAKQLGRTTIFTAQQVSDLQLVLAKMGVSADDITKVQGNILALAQATDSDLAQAADVVSSTLRAFGKDMDQGAHLSDIMAASFSNSALSMDAFSNSMQYVAPVAKAAGVSMEETTAMLAVLANNGIRGSKAGRALRRILSDVGATGKPVGQAIKEMASAGLDLEQAMDEVGRSAQTQLLILAENIDTIPELAQGYEDSAGSAKGMAETMDNTTFGAFKRMQSAIEGVQLSIGQVLAPMLERLSVIVSNAMGLFQQLSPEMQRMAVIGGMIAAAIGPLLMLLPSLASGFGMIAGVLSGPVLLAIGAVVGAIVLIRKNWDLIRAYFTDGPGAAVLETIRENVLKAVQGIMDLWSALVNFLMMAWDTFGSSIIDLAQRAFTRIGRVVSRAASVLSNLFNALSSALQGDWGAMWQRIQNMLLDAVILILDGVSYLITEVLGVVDAGLNALGYESDLSGGFGAIVEEAIGYLDGLKYEFETTTKDAESFFDTMGSGFSQLFSGSATSVEAPTVEQDAEPQLLQQQALGEATLKKPMEFKPPEMDPWKKFGNEFRDLVSNLTTFQDMMAQSAAQMGQAVADGFMAMASGAEDAKERMKAGLKTVVDTTFAAATAHMIEASVGAGKHFGPAAPVVIPALIAGGMALVRGAFGAITGFADGGIVSGPTMGLVAEYPGARTNPEVIAPLDKLQSMIGGGTQNVTGTIRGRDIVLANERGGFSRRRAFG